jgi:Papain family cysteine protease
MEDDPQDQQQQDFNDDSGGGGNQPGGRGGMGGLLSFLPLLLGLFRGKKGILLLAVVAIGGYFLMKNGGCSTNSIVSKLFSQSGYHFDRNEFDKAKIYEGLDEGNPKNATPEQVSLLNYAPPRQNQGEQGSCVAWSSAYAARTILEAAATKKDPAQLAFSPSFLYNQIGLDGCQGSYINRAMDFMVKKGAVPLNAFPYDPTNCSRLPSPSLEQQALQYRMLGYTRLTKGDNTNAISVQAIKEHLATDAPVVIGMMVGQSFMQPMMGRELWEPQAGDRSMVGMGGHAMCVIGYDDRKFGGAFQIMNSWGPEWGKNGIGWVRYGDFKNYVREAYGVSALPKQGVAANVPLECEVGLIRNDNRQNIPLRVKGSNEFETVSTVAMGTRFKMQVNNVTECYIYVFGQETDGSSYVLFPYTPKHSPYCGITGFRLFPRDKSMVPDSVGVKDYMAVVVTKSPLDPAAFNAAINKSSRADYAGKLNDALQAAGGGIAQFSSSGKGNIYLKAQTAGDKALGCVVEVNKSK